MSSEIATVVPVERAYAFDLRCEGVQDTPPLSVYTQGHRSARGIPLTSFI
jgi:hypothetical protein